ncbi:LptA/OstA family protein [Sphingomonas sp.]|uniref:LptA/OstA family protein n=1 Tax=Sphingomonas sp. TaxID=28214 RepID=UPI003B007338
MIPRGAALAALALIAGGGIALAQSATAPGSKHDSNAPIDWEADRIEVQDRDHKATLVGNVRVRQQEMTLTADRTTALYSGSIAAGDGGGGGAGPKVQRLDANGHVVVTRPGEVARGNYGIYDLDRKLVTLIGNVSLDRNGSVVHGGRLVIDQNTNRATVDGSAIGGQGAAGTGGRVSGRFLVDQGKGAPSS